MLVMYRFIVNALRAFCVAIRIIKYVFMYGTDDSNYVAVKRTQKLPYIHIFLLYIIMQARN